MRVLIFHGYLLRGTGSNVYNANLAAALAGLGHEVHLLSQDRAPEELPFVDAIGTWERGELAVRERRAPASVTAYRPEIGGLLPTYVADRYDGIEARPFPELSEAELERYIDANVRAVRDVVARARPDVALANHLVMGPAILARALAGTGIPFAVKIHGSALEYTVKPHPRFLPFAHEGLDRARGVLVGSRHTAESLWAAIADPSLPPRTRLGPPGVDVHEFTPRAPEEAAAGPGRLAARLREHAAAGGDEPDESAFARDLDAAADALERIHPGEERVVGFVGKLIVSKGVDLLLAAWPLVLERVPNAHLVVVGFGAFREGCELLVRALAARDEAELQRLVAAGRELEGGPRARLRWLGAFLDGLEDEAAERYFAAAARMPGRVTFTGRLEHDELVDVLPAFEAQVVPSTFPEAFGMVAAEAASCGALPVSADHSGLAEVTRALAEAVPAEARDWLSFAVGPDSVPDIAERLVAWLEAPEDLRAATRDGLVRRAHERYSWEGVARGVIAAAQGRLDELPKP